MQRILTAFLMSATLSACASNSSLVEQTTTAPAPNAASIIANNLSAHPKMDQAATVPAQLIFPTTTRVDHVELSDQLRAVRTDLYGWAWKTCIRANVAGLPHAYAVFVAGDHVVDSRMALALDQCDQGHYRPLPVVRPDLPKPAKGQPKNGKTT